MFQLIVAVISIALVAALALASIFYGGEAFTRGQLKAQVATMVNQAQQISGANTLYKNDNGGNDADTVAELVSPPNGGVRYLTVDITPPSKIATGAWGIDNQATSPQIYVSLSPNADVTKVTDAVVDANVGEVVAGAYYFPL
jgi:hypothetical protein